MNLLSIYFSYKYVGVPPAPEKQDDASNCIIYLGIIIDTVQQELRLPQEKLDRLLDMIGE